MKYSPSGTRLWATVYNGPSNDYDEPAGLVVDASGNIYVAGQTLGTTTNYDIVLVKYNSAGVQQWAQIWNNTTNLQDYANSIAIDNSGNVYVAGLATVTGFNANYVTLKYNSSGVLQWARQYNNPVNSGDEAYHVKADNSGNVYVTGTSTAMTTGSDFLTIKYNSNGDSLWVRRYSGTTDINEIPYGFAVDQNGNVYVSGFSRGPSNSTDFATLKYNSAGVQQWVAIYDSTQGQDIPEDLEVDAAGNVYVTGRTRINSSYNDFATIKYNTAGVRQWIAIYDNPPESRDDYGYDVELDALGNVYVTGNSQASGTDRDALTIKYNNSGAQQWVARYDVTNSEEAFVVKLDASNNVYVTGYQSSGGADFLTIKYSQTVGINQISSEIPEGFSLSQNYPNPFNPVTKIKFELTRDVKRQTSDVKLSIYNALGEVVATLVDQELSAGTYEADWDASGYSSGVYFYKLEAGSPREAGDFVQVKSMMLLK